MFRYIIFVICFFCMACPDKELTPDSILTIKNNSGQRILPLEVLRLPGDTLLSGYPFPIAPEGFETLDVMPGGSNQSETYYRRILNRDSGEMLMIFVFSRDTIKSVPWEGIEKRYAVLRRYDLSLEDLEAMDWVVNFP